MFTDKSKRTRWLQVVLVGAALLSAICSGACAGARTIPSPNAWDYYIAATKLVINNLNTSDKNRISSDLSRQSELLPQQQEELLSKNGKALSKLREGLAYDCFVPPRLSIGSDSFPEISKFRDLANLLRMESTLRSAHADYAGAMNSLLDAMQLGSDVSRGGNMIEALIGMAVMYIGRASAPELVSKLDGEQARAAARRAEKTAASSARLSDVMRIERAYIKKHLMSDLKSRNWRSKVAKASVILDTDKPDPELVAWLKARGKKEVLRSFESFTAKVIARAEMPYAIAKNKPRITENPYTSYIMLCSFHLHFAYRDTQEALLPVALALQAWNADYENYPDSLSALTPLYLRKIALDPFADNRVLRYKNLGSTYLLYSVGPDGKDNGGKAIKLKNGIKIPSRDDTGDIVYVTEHR